VAAEVIMTISVVMAAGGTGGHLVPALAIAGALRRTRPDARICFIGTDRGLTDDIVGRAGYERFTTSVQPFARSARGVLGPLSMVPATAQARAVIRRVGASVVVGMGGYPSLPAIAAARLTKVPSVIHEANAVPGLANETAARLTPNVAVAFPGTVFKGRTTRVVGMPLRDAIAGFDRDALRAEALDTFGLDRARKTLLVFGGSLGAATLSAAAVELATRWVGRSDVQSMIIAGERDESSRSALRAAGVPDEHVHVHRFVDRMELAYAAADVVVARAGGSTVAELAVVGLPSVLVPLPHARRREQHANAAYLVEAGGAVVVDNGELTGERLDHVVSTLLADDEGREKMSAAARSVARPDAAAEMARWIMELADA
jgi:UDP-N-acetylglucosamine--N-acetylmuramyl-(pentapeptide) pyrophosphoryl-undecaprenol N-acetylglucosamine transferase